MEAGLLSSNRQRVAGAAETVSQLFHIFHIRNGSHSRADVSANGFFGPGVDCILIAMGATLLSS